MNGDFKHFPEVLGFMDFLLTHFKFLGIKKKNRRFFCWIFGFLCNISKTKKKLGQNLVTFF